MVELLLSIPNPWELLLDILGWIAKHLKPILPLLGVFAVILISWFLSRFIRWVKQVIGNLFTPVGAFFAIIGLIALAYFLITYKLI